MDRRDLGNGAHALVSSDLESRGFLAAFTERTGGLSLSPYDSLNLGLRTNDARGRVIENRRRVIEALDIPRFTTGQQVHGARLVQVGRTRAGAGFEDPETAIPAVDALAASRTGLPLAVLTADCLPIALASPKEQHLVVVHAGWRGMAAGIVPRAIREFERSPDVLGVIGPAIGACHYEVGEDVAAAVASGSEAGIVSERREGRRYLDLPRTAAKAFRAFGIRRIEVSDVCTACYPDRFFSHRRDGVTGRQALVSMLL